MAYESEEQQQTLESFSTEAKANIRARVMRMRRLLAHIEQNGTRIPKKKLIALYCIKEGISKSTTYGYLEEYFDCEILVNYGDHVILMDVYEEIKKKDSERLQKLIEGDK